MTTCTIRREVSRVAYAKNGNTHNPTIEYYYITSLGIFYKLKEAKTALTEELGTVEFAVINSDRTKEIQALYPYGNHPK